MDQHFYFLTFISAIILALVLTPISMAFARVVGLVDKPNVRKIHFRPTPRAGGLAIIASIAGVVIPALILRDHYAGGPELHRVWLALVACGIVFIIGIVDDFFAFRRSHYKLLALLGASMLVCASGFTFNSIRFHDNYILELGPFGPLMTMLWLVGVTTAINFIDGLDGLAGGICAITAASIALLSANKDPVSAIIALSIVGSLCGFLVFNFNPAKVFMGDCGSLFLGFTLATTSLICYRNTRMTASITLPALAMGVPIFDTMLTMVRRGILQRRSLFSAERGHIHHKLMDAGAGHRNAVLILYAVTIICAFSGIAAWQVDNVVIRIFMVAIQPAILIGFFTAVGALRVSVISSAYRHNTELGKLKSRYRHTFDEMQLRFMAVRSFEAWWLEVCEALNRLDFVRLTINVINRDGTPRRLSWHKADLSGSEPTLRMSIPIRHRRSGGPMLAEIEVSATESLEMAGHRVTVFGRLMEENSLAAVPDVRKSTNNATRWSYPGAPATATSASKIVGNLKIAIVHDFLYTYAGAERVLEQMLTVFPQAQLFSLFDFVPADKRGFLAGRPVTTSFLQKMPMARSHHRHYLPLMPLAIEQLDVSEFDIVISSSYVVAKGVLTRPDQLHICYCHSPVRFAWDLQHQYLHEAGLRRGLKSVLVRIMLHYIRNWDSRSANGVDVFLTNSNFVSRRVEKVYGRPSTTLYPPVDVDGFALEKNKDDYYLTASRMVPYKRIDLIVEAFSAMPDRKLIVVGEGPDFEKIQAKAGPNVKLVGHQSAEQLVDYMRHAKGFVFAAEEDFGIVPVEAQACGTPVIAFGRGGATESVIDGVTGVFFPYQSVASLCEAVVRFEAMYHEFDPAAIRQHVERFNAVRFRTELLSFVESEWLESKKHDKLENSVAEAIDANNLTPAARLRRKLQELESGTRPQAALASAD
jgi:UDP-N-acetylmuramyl pentapeptide phosphotransferase/UDP-N-acetylglucosamine-1-phosphate transferase/glycosyltransferase involved in cell wall biosynthesis